MSEGKFIFAPVEVFQDRRLTLMQMRVLLALFSFRGRNTNTVWPKRSAMNERTGYSEDVISRVTGQLVKLGWLLKEGAGGRSAPVKYTIVVPESLTNQGVVLDEETLTKSVTLTESVTLTDQCSKTLTGSVRGKELTKDLTKKEKINKKKFPDLDFSELPATVPAKTAAHFAEHRRKLKAPLTQHAFDLAMREAEKAPSVGLTPEQAIDETIAAGWKGVRLDWLAKRVDSRGKSRQFSQAGNRREHSRIIGEALDREMQKAFGCEMGDGVVCTV